MDRDRMNATNNRLQLSGFAASQAEIDRAVVIARNTAGVKSVRNDIRLK